MFNTADRSIKTERFDSPPTSRPGSAAAAADDDDDVGRPAHVAVT